MFQKKRSLQGTLDQSLTLKLHLHVPLFIRKLKSGQISKCPETVMMSAILAISRYFF
jgi:hypothetical protein